MSLTLKLEGGEMQWNRSRRWCLAVTYSLFLLCRLSSHCQAQGWRYPQPAGSIWRICGWDDAKVHPAGSGEFRGSSQCCSLQELPGFAQKVAGFKSTRKEKQFEDVVVVVASFRWRVIMSWRWWSILMASSRSLPSSETTPTLSSGTWSTSPQWTSHQGRTALR